MKIHLVTLPLLFVVLMQGGSAWAMSPQELEQAHFAGAQVAASMAKYNACKAENAGELKQAYLKHGLKCGATQDELADLTRNFDQELTQSTVGPTEHDSCVYTPEVAAQMVARIVELINSYDCR